MTFGELQTAVYQVCGYPTPVQPIVTWRVKNWINEGHRHCLRLPGLVELRQRSGIPFTTVAGQAIYNFPVAFERVDAVVERTTHRRLLAISRDVFRSIDPAETSSGTPTCYAPEGWQQRFAMPNGGPIWGVSTWPADTTQMVQLIGVPVYNAFQLSAPEIKTRLNGLTRVDVGAGYNFADIISWSLSSTCGGAVVLWNDQTAGQIMSIISPGKTSVQYWCLRLWPTPSGAVTYYVDGQVEIPELVNETDIPMLPPSFHDLIAAFARVREYERTGDSRLSVAATEWERGLGHLRASVNFPDDWKPVAGSMSSATRTSN